MKHVQVWTNTDEKCGNAQYGRDLAEQLGRWYKVSVGMTLAMGVDVVIVNWHPAVVPIDVGNIKWFQYNKKKVILIHQNSTPTAEAELFRVADAVVAHESVKSSVPVRWIEHPVPVVTGIDCLAGDPTIGTAGFPFPWKRFDVAAEAAKRTGAKFLAIAPESLHMDTTGEILKIQQKLNGQAEIHREWLSVHDVVRKLARCWLTIFWFQSQSVEDTLGQTGSARLAVAAQRPMIISRHRKFRTMIERYASELYVADTEEEVYQMADEVLDRSWAGARFPLRQFHDTNWVVAGERYRDLIEEVTAC